MAQRERDKRPLAIEGVKGQRDTKTPEDDSVGWGMVRGWEVGEMRLKCVCGAECYPATMEELRMYQQLDCPKSDNGKHNFKIFKRGD